MQGVHRNPEPPRLFSLVSERRFHAKEQSVGFREVERGQGRSFVQRDSPRVEDAKHFWPTLVEIQQDDLEEDRARRGLYIEDPLAGVADSTAIVYGYALGRACDSAKLAYDLHGSHGSLLLRKRNIGGSLETMSKRPPRQGSASNSFTAAEIKLLEMLLTQMRQARPDGLSVISSALVRNPNYSSLCRKVQVMRRRVELLRLQPQPGQIHDLSGIASAGHDGDDAVVAGSEHGPR